MLWRALGVCLTLVWPRALWAQSGLDRDAQPQFAPGRFEQGRDIYNFRCYFCHGYSGDAQTLAARMLVPAPRDFTAADPAQLDTQRILDAVRNGRPGTAMQPFAVILSPAEQLAVVEYVRRAFVLEGRPNTRYHSPENGWPEHERFRDSFPFATGEIPLETPAEQLTAAELEGRRHFLRACVSCHDPTETREQAVLWEPQALSYPRPGFSPGDHAEPSDALSGATPFARHEIAPPLRDPTPLQAEGERLFQANCAFCHGADGSGRNWIGTFLQPRPRDLTDAEFMRGMTDERLHRVIREGLPGTSMPAWQQVLEAGQIDALVAYIRRVFHPLSAAGD